MSERIREALQAVGLGEEEIKDYLKSLLREELGELPELIPRLKQALGQLQNIPQIVEETLKAHSQALQSQALQGMAKGNGKGLGLVAGGELDLGKLIALQFIQNVLKTGSDDDAWIEENIIKPLRKYAKIRDALSLLEPPSPSYDLLFKVFAEGMRKGSKLPLALNSKQKTSSPARGLSGRPGRSLSDELYKRALPKAGQS